MKLLIATLLIGISTYAQHPCWINGNGNLECKPFKIAEFAQDRRDVDYYKELFRQSHDSVLKCTQIAENANKGFKATLNSVAEQYESKLKLCAEKGELMAKTAVNDYKQKFFNRRDVYFVAGYVIGTVVSVWAVTEIKDSNQ